MYKEKSKIKGILLLIFIIYIAERMFSNIKLSKTISNILHLNINILYAKMKFQTKCLIH